MVGNKYKIHASTRTDTRNENKISVMTFLDFRKIGIKHHTALPDGNKPGSQLEQGSDDIKAPINI